MAMISLVAAACGQSSSDTTESVQDRAAVTRSLDAVAPALAQYDDTVAEGDLWTRENLSSRDRSLVAVSALIARNQTDELAAEVERGLDNGLTPAEISEVITHLAFYASWPSALSAAEVVGPVFENRDVDADDLPHVDASLLPQDLAAEEQRAAGVERVYGTTAPGVVQYTDDVLFDDLWLRPDLAPRDHSLATVSALVAGDQVAQVTYHLGRAMDNGLTSAEASETPTQLAFYAGWPDVFSAISVVRDVLSSRQ
ncbi:carboxymuconolactone decarboxylase family protein [Actinomycetes bacterium M1A6_2h]